MKANDEEKPDRLPTVSGPHLGPANLSTPPDVEGYEILRVLGEGGMGVVYLARQEQPIERQVALKVIKAGMDSKQVVTRFETERQALASLDHPNIAQVYDAGTTRSGHPYFSMEYISGPSITEHCDRHGLSIEERLGLFIQVCEGVQHAHQKGIIHRDIKPSNVLVYTQDSRALPKIIDFGVAKALTASLTKETFFTEQGQLLGTPEYMSPEQAQMTTADIDTRTDIYSLGVVLYELLVGMIPFDPKTLREGGVENIRRMICEEGPKTPSMRLSTLSGEASTNVARLRCTDVRTLTRQVHDDLDWITLKAMEKDRMRRYGAAGELAADILRHMSHEPVIAGPPSTSYRLKKFIRRHRHFATASTVVAVSLVLGFIVSTALYFRAESLRAEAQKASQQAEQAAEEARQAADKEVAARAEAQTVAEYLTDDVLGLVAPEHAKSRQVPVKALLDMASENLEHKFDSQPLAEAGIRQALGETYRKLGEYASAEPHLEWAYEIREHLCGKEDPSTITSLAQLGWLYFLQARYGKAEPLLKESLNLRLRELGPEHPETLESAVRLALLYCYHAPWAHRAEMLRLLRVAFETGGRLLGDDHEIPLEARHGLAMWYASTRSFDGLQLCEEGREIAEVAFGQEHPLTLKFVSCLAVFRSWQARYEEAEIMASEALDVSQSLLGTENPVTLQCMWALSLAYSCQFRLGEAEDLLKETVRVSQHLLGKEHFQTLRYNQHLAFVHIKQGRIDEARRLLTKVLEGRRRLLGEDHGWVLGVVGWMMNLYAMQGRSAELRNWCSEEIERLDSQLGDNRNAIVSIYTMLARIQSSYPDPKIRSGSEAMKNATRACELTNWKDWPCIAALAEANAEVGDFSGAVKWHKKATDIAMSEPHRALNAALLEWRLKLYEAGRPYREGFLSFEGYYFLAEGNYEGAERALTKALEHSRQVLGEQHPETRGCIIALAELCDTWGKPEEAKKWRIKLPQTEAVEE
ncbi:MAG: tetratricopeptide repeat protein [Planctomycetota bacterium]|jgi:serine/threonine protein kinase